MLQIYLLGPFQLICDRKPVPETAWHTRQARQLLKILVARRGKIVSRDALIETLWPDADPAKAATTLRTAVNALRNILEPNRPPYTPSTFIVAHAPGYKFQFTDQIWVDVMAFEAALDEAASTPDSRRQQELLAQAIALYRDDYLADDPYADWAYLERERLTERYLEALSRLAESQANQGEYERAIAGLRRVLARDPGREPIYRALMRYYLHLGNTVAALKVFEQLRTYLADELGADPSPETLALHRSILNGQFNWQPVPPISAATPPSPLEEAFVGRTAEIQALKSLLAEAGGGRGSIVSLTGEPGVGKTKLASAALAWAAGRQMAGLAARCQQVEQTLPFAPLIEAVETFMLHHAERSLAQLPLADKTHLAQLFPALVWEVDVNPAGGAFSENNRQALVGSLVRALLHLAEDGLLLFVDDLQWADEATLILLANLSRYVPQSKILVLMAYRTEEVDRNLPLGQFLPSLNRLERVKTLRLERLTPHEIELYLQIVAPDIESRPDLLQTLARRLHHITGGNPLFLTETLRALLHNNPRALTLPNAQTLLTDPALERPSSHITDMILARLEQLPPEARPCLDIAAAIGRDFSVDLLESLSTTDPLPIIAMLLQRQFLVELEPGRLGFSHHLLREVIYSRLSPLARQRLHQRVAHALISLYGRQAGPRAAAIAEHSLLAGAAFRQQAVTFAVLAADYSMRTFGFEQAARHYRHALDLARELPPTPDLETWIRQAFQGLGLAHESLADWDAARDAYRQWQAWAQKSRRPELVLMAQHRLASMLGITGQLDQSAAITARIARQFPPGTPPAIIEAHERLNLLISTKTQPPAWTSAGWPTFVPSPVKVDRPWEQLIRILGDEQAAQTLNLYGWALTLQGHTELAEVVLHYAAQVSAGYNQPALQATSYHLLAQLWNLRGDYTRMDQALRQALALVEDMPHLRWAVMWGLIHQAFVDMRWNQLARAGERLQKLNDDLAGRKALRSHQLSVLVGLGLLAMFEQNLEQAARYFEQALANSKNLYASNYVVVYLSRARLNRKRGLLDEAQDDIMQAMSFAGQRGMLADYVSAVVEAARFDRAAGQPHHVIPLLEQAEAMTSQAGLLPARLSARLALMHVFAQLEAPAEARWYQKLARIDRDAIAASIPSPADRAAYLSRRDFCAL